jgi:type I restriction enzyme S subunit
MGLRTIGSLLKTSKGKKPLKLTDDQAPGLVPYIDISAVEHGTRRQWASPVDARVVPAGTLVMVWDGARAGLVGLAPFEGALGSTLAALESPLDRGYLAAFLKLHFAEINTNQRGSGIPHVNPEFLFALEIPVVDRAAQRSIADLSDSASRRQTSASAHLASARRAIGRFRQSVLVAACSGRLTTDLHPLPTTDDNELPPGWRHGTVDSIAAAVPRAIQSGPFGSNLKHSEFGASGRLVIGIDNVLDGKFSLGKQHRISDQKFRELEKYAVRPLDVLITVMATVGRVCVVPADIEPAIITKHVYRVTVDQGAVDPTFVTFALRGHPQVREQINSQVRGQTRPGINGAIVKRLELALPPLSEQREIVRRASRMLTLADAIEQRIETTSRVVERTTQSFLARAFRRAMLEMNGNGAPTADPKERRI